MPLPLTDGVPPAMPIPPLPLPSEDPLPLPPPQNDIPLAEQGPTNQSNSTMSSGEGTVGSEANAGKALTDGAVAVPETTRIQACKKQVGPEQLVPEEPPKASGHDTVGKLEAVPSQARGRVQRSNCVDSHV